MDAIAFFDHVLVPWERVFLLGDVDLVNDTAVATHSHIHTAHQGAAKNIAKSELVLGVALLMAETLGSTQVPHVQERLGELMVHTEVMKASLRAAEADAQPDRWGVMCPAGLPLEVIRTLFMNVYPRMVEILQLLGSSSFMIIPSEADFHSALKPEIEQHLATDTASARERVKLFRLAWDLTCSAFAGRQVLYERFFAGDPLNRAQFLYSIYPREPLMERIREFLADDQGG
jgi:4-hydroxyphenylacetate 3-monooxygenase